MSADASETAISADASELREALIAFCRLSPEAVEQIDEATRGTHLNFCDAAVHVGLVTENEAAETQAWVRAAISRRNSNIVETALRRHGTSKSIAVRHSLMGRPGNRLHAACDADNPHAERLRALRTELLLLTEGGRDASCLAVVSPCSHEGRSQLAAELAVAFSQLSQRTLLIDADLRRPTLHSLFGVEVQWGLAQALAFGEPPHLIGVEGLPYLTVLPAGPRVSNPLELLSGGRMENLLRHWRRDQAFIVIDTPPVSQYADALTLAAMVGQVVLVSRTETTPYKELKGLLQRLGPTHARVLGAVVNGT
ncbi:MAG TPA: CpsD/CapB family tyrosine-protein kinase [Steroidobacteraceae bacterium]|jgi:receptor protein-tyrosine kinase|nr:CpsD/CapB family tyrosine-protein kinase [Steroidobacteraceae bacterium]